MEGSFGIGRGTFLKGYEVLRYVVNECPHPQPQIHADCPRIRLSRYRDNIFLMFAAIPPMLEHDARIAIRSFLVAVYGIELQWEMQSEITTWGEGQVDCINDRLRPTSKGTALHHGDVPNECHSWVDVASFNAKLVWRSFFPSLLQKCLWYATNGEDVWCNVASVIANLVHKRYPNDWWRPTLLGWFDKFHSARFFSWGDLMTHLDGEDPKMRH